MHCQPTKVIMLNSCIVFKCDACQVIVQDIRRHHRSRHRDEKVNVRKRRRSLRQTLKAVNGYGTETDEGIADYAEMETATPSPPGKGYKKGRGRSYVDDYMIEEHREEVTKLNIMRAELNFKETVGKEHKITTSKIILPKSKTEVIPLSGPNTD